MSPADQSLTNDHDSTEHQSKGHTHELSHDVMDTNPHTNNLEFYGASSSVAFLKHVESISNSQVSGSADRSLVSMLHNSESKPGSKQHNSSSRSKNQIHADRFYFRVAPRFLDAYFSNIHFIQPVFDEESFRTRCENLWFNGAQQQPLSFLALYYATLSLGSLVLDSEEWIKQGSPRFAWGRKLLDEALSAVSQRASATDIEMAQCYYMISKVYQHELNPHVAYLYSGQAARIALAIGINRAPRDQKATDPRNSTTASRTWWAIYCQDIHTSFALGRPDSLGPDEYHSQPLPQKHESVDSSSSSTSVIETVPCMVRLSRVMRKTGLLLYTTSCSVEEQLKRAEMLESELEAWLDSLPSHLRTVARKPVEFPFTPRHAVTFVDKQSVVLHLREMDEYRPVSEC